MCIILLCFAVVVVTDVDVVIKQIDGSCHCLDMASFHVFAQFPNKHCQCVVVSDRSVRCSRKTQLNLQTQPILDVPGPDEPKENPETRMKLHDPPGY